MQKYRLYYERCGRVVTKQPLYTVNDF